MIKNDVEVRKLAKGQVFVIGEAEDDCNKCLIQKIANEVFEGIKEVYEQRNEEKLFDEFMSLMTSFVDSKEYIAAAVLQKELLKRCEQNTAAIYIWNFLHDNSEVAEIYFRQMMYRASDYHDDMIANPSGNMDDEESPKTEESTFDT